MQLRLDFIAFALSGPSTISDSIGRAAAGRLIKNNGGTFGVEVTDAGQCLTDAFTVSSPGNTVPPVLCGNLQGEHGWLNKRMSQNCVVFEDIAALHYKIKSGVLV